MVNKLKLKSNKRVLFFGTAIVLLVSLIGFSVLAYYRANNAKAAGNNWTSVHFNNATMKVCVFTSSSNTPRIRTKVYNPTSQVRWAQLIVNKEGPGQHEYQPIEPANFGNVIEYPDRSGRNPNLPGGDPRTFFFKVNVGADTVTKGINYGDINKCDKPFGANQVVEVATIQYERHGGINLETNGFYLVYTQGSQVPWCTHFINWVFNEANQEFPPNSYTYSVAGLKSYLESRNKFRTKASGYRPKPGDIAIYQNGMSHANIVISVSGNSYVAIGGNESDGIRRTTNSLSSASLTGFGSM